MSKSITKKISGYLYARTHSSYEEYNAFKLGVTQNIVDRDKTYATGEVKRGTYIKIFELAGCRISCVEAKLHRQFVQSQIKLDGGTEFYHKDMLDSIETFLAKNKIKYRNMPQQEICQLLNLPSQSEVSQRKVTEEQELVKQKIKKCSDKAETPEKPLLTASQEDAPSENETTFLTPRPDQKETIDLCLKHFETNNKGLLVLSCGVGKTLLSLWVAEAMMKQNKGTLRMCIGVPSILLLLQWEEKIAKLFPKVNLLKINADPQSAELQSFLETHNNESFIILTTYKSSVKVRKAYTDSNFLPLDFVICDEAHHLTATTREIDTESQKNAHILFVNGAKQLSLTATLKELVEENVTDESQSAVISNTSRTFFGEIIQQRSLLWAIENNIVCDYVVQALVTDDPESNMDFSNDLWQDTMHEMAKMGHRQIYQDMEANCGTEADKRLFIAAYAAVMSMSSDNKGHACGDMKKIQAHHVLVYCNSLYSCERVLCFIRILVPKLLSEDLWHTVYANKYDSKINEADQKDILQAFQNYPLGILVCVYCLGEGYDLPLLDGVVFAENMSSNIRIVQSALRASRKDARDGGKVAKIIIPTLNKENWMDDPGNSDMKKIKEIVRQIGTEDETIIHKIRVYKAKCVPRNQAQKQRQRQSAQSSRKGNETKKGNTTTTQKTQKFSCLGDSKGIDDNFQENTLLQRKEIENSELNEKDENVTAVIPANPHAFYFKENDYNTLGVFDEQLTSKIRLITRERMAFGMSFQRLKRIVSAYQLKTKQEYFAKCEQDIRLPRDPETDYCKQFTNWVDFLGIPVCGFYNFQECQNKIQEYLKIYPAIREYRLDLAKACKELCKLDARFPESDLWLDFYKLPDLSKILQIPRPRRLVTNAV